MRKMLAAFTLAVAAICALAGCTGGLSGPLPPWRIELVDGPVQVMEEGQAFRPVVPDDVLKVGSVVTTGANSSARLTNGFQTLTMYSNSRLKIPEDRHDGITRVLQDLGTIVFDVDHKQRSHFQVETPLLTAVVKGTRFVVRVGLFATTVQTWEGLVEVGSVEGTTRRDVPKGRQARVGKAFPRDVDVAVFKEAEQGSQADASGPGYAAADDSAGSTGRTINAGPITVPGAASGPDSPWGVLPYVIGIAVAWAFFASVIVLVRGHLRNRRAQTKQKRDPK
jgi:FecR protein